VQYDTVLHGKALGSGWLVENAPTDLIDITELLRTALVAGNTDVARNES
jgi:hypothetical protein